MPRICAHAGGTLSACSTNFRRPCARQLARIVLKSLGRLRERASHIWMGDLSPRPRLSSSALRFSPACLTPVKNRAIWRPSTLLMIPEVKTPVRSGFGCSPGRPSAAALERSRRDASRRLPIHARIFIGVSSLWSTSPCARRRARREDLCAEVTAQLLEKKDRRRQRRLSRHADQHFRPLPLFVDL